MIEDEDFWFLKFVFARNGEGLKMTMIDVWKRGPSILVHGEGQVSALDCARSWQISASYGLVGKAEGELVGNAWTHV